MTAPLEALRATLDDLPADALPALIGELEGLKARARATDAHRGAERSACPSCERDG